MRGAIFSACACLLTFAAGAANAATSTTTFNVQITITSQCTISATTLDFGSQPGTITANIDQQNTVNVTCNLLTPWTVSLNAGTGTGGTVVLRKMTGPLGATVDYTIYRDLTRTQVWGDGTSGTFTVSGTGTGLVQPQIGFGRVPAPQSVPTGSYLDTITATISF
jgi:spore coat protein U domain-containing protein, fimbrial subunit CupE1/2/3/6